MKTDNSNNNDDTSDISNKQDEKIKHKLRQYCLEGNDIFNYAESVLSSDTENLKKTARYNPLTVENDRLYTGYKCFEELAEDILSLISGAENKQVYSIDINDIILTFKLISENIMQNKISMTSNIDLKYRYENYINIKLDNLTYPNNMFKDKFYYIFNAFISLNILIRIPVIQLNERFFHDYKLYIAAPTLLTDWLKIYSVNENVADVLLENIVIAQVHAITTENQDLRMYSLLVKDSSLKIDLVIEDINRREVHLIKINDSPENNLKCFNNISVLKLFEDYKIKVYDINANNSTEILKQLKLDLSY